VGTAHRGVGSIRAEGNTDSSLVSNPLNDLNEMLDRHLTLAVKTIFFVNVVVFLLMTIMDAAKPGFVDLVFAYFSSSPPFLLQPWRHFTYMFLHGGAGHLLFNMLGLWFFAPPLESRWGRRTFWAFYLTVGVGASLGNSVYSLVAGRGVGAEIVGASGALYGVMLAFAAYYPDAVVLLYFLFPIKMKYLIPLIVVFYDLLSGPGDRVSHTTHLAGLAVAYIWLALHHREWDIRRWRWRR
jgi:membrane associated rhomboid family serine protease